uniref:Uncharacterized protein n=1 Tax=Trepomonas sp. PC1 TaxID=1076344 RepID=A0A146KEG0_9EUKA|eukprot:JAP93699.1 Hypothetical protein TPC1_13922 [Trepomonas sp. PC1]
MSNSERKGFWIKMQKMCQINASKLHDYFHNKWSKQYCDCIKPHKQFILQIVDYASGETKQEKIQNVLQQIKVMFPNKIFHQQTLYQLIAYKIKTQTLKNSSNSIYQNSSNCNSTTQNEIQGKQSIQLPYFDIQENEEFSCFSFNLDTINYLFE